MNRPLIYNSSLFIVILSFFMFTAVPLKAQDNTGSNTSKRKSSIDSTTTKNDRNRGDRGTRSDTTIHKKTHNRMGAGSSVTTTTTTTTSLGSDSTSKHSTKTHAGKTSKKVSGTKGTKSETSMNQGTTSSDEFAVRMARDLKMQINLSKEQTSQIEGVLNEYHSEVTTAMRQKNSTMGVHSGTESPSGRAGAKSGSESGTSGYGTSGTSGYGTGTRDSLHNSTDTSRAGAGSDMDRKGQSSYNTNMPPTGNTRVEGTDVNSTSTTSPTTSSISTTSPTTGSGTTYNSAASGTSVSVGDSTTTGNTNVSGGVSGSVGTTGTLGTGSVGTTGTLGTSPRGSIGGNTSVSDSLNSGKYGTSGSGTIGTSGIKGSGSVGTTGVQGSGSIGTTGSQSSGSISGTMNADSTNDQYRAGAGSGSESTNMDEIYTGDRMTAIERAQSAADNKIKEILDDTQKPKYEDLKITWWSKVRQEAMNVNSSRAGANSHNTDTDTDHKDNSGNDDTQKK